MCCSSYFGLNFQCSEATSATIRKKEKNKIQCNGIGNSADVKDNGNEILVHSEFEDSSYADDLTYHTYGTVGESVDKSGINPYAGSGLSRDGTPFQTEVVFYNSDRIIIRNKASPEVDVKPSTHDVIRSALDIDADDIRRLKIRGIVLMVALSLHMIFDGLAIGLMTKSSKVWQLLGAVALHKCLVFFTIGLQSLEILASAKKSVFVIVFLAIISPIGILIGEAINSFDDVTARETVPAVLQGIATGTFLFVTFFEILFRELGAQDPELLKIMFSFIGFVLIALVRLMTND
ncbi:zinc transporter ZIP2-like [Dreissena polymorpha]|uniref:zinc transporter ZIP2-like n=1 Tax=Dreissena polymorpha TaxID=45954 RepID=UPI002263E6E1|nr:zinc transporter ZIP2-like [Dreissena polymorpha]